MAELEGTTSTSGDVNMAFVTQESHKKSGMDQIRPKSNAHLHESDDYQGESRQNVVTAKNNH